MKIVIQNLQKKIPINPKNLEKAVLEVLQIEKIKKTGQINLFFISGRKIRELNLKYRKENNTTDVLAFDISRFSNQLLADIFISTDALKHNARIFNTSLQYETYLYAIHGTLHLIGYDDRNLKKRYIMQKKEKYLLNRLRLKPKLIS